MKGEPKEGATVSFSGPAFFARCIRCSKLTMADRLYWGADFLGDGSGNAVYAVICGPCANPIQESRAKVGAP